MSDQYFQPLSGNAMPRCGGIATMMRLPQVENASGLSVDQFAQTVDDPDEAFRNIVRQKAKVEETWVDADGTRPG